MKHASHFLALVASTALVTGCGTNAQFKPRAVGAQAVMPVGDLVAQGRFNFTLNNVALALEQFRRASRLQPDNVDALNGVAACYDRMGRFDMSRLYYEKALALAPNNPKTLHNFQVSLTMQGRHDEAMALAREAAQPQPQVSAALVSASEPEGVTVDLPPPAPVLPVPPPEPRLAALIVVEAPMPAGPRLERLSLGEVALVTVKQSGAKQSAQPRTADRVVQVTRAELVKQTRTGSEWVFPETPVTSGATMSAPAAKPVAPKPSVRAAVDVAPPARPVAKPVAALVPPPAAPRRGTSAAAPRVQVLNAVGRKGLAGRYSVYLRSRGWADPRAADARRMRRATIILYPVGSRAQAAALARRLPIRAVLAPSKRKGSDLLLVLGSDALTFDNRLRLRFARA